MLPGADMGTRKQASRKSPMAFRLHFVFAVSALIFSLSSTQAGIRAASVFSDHMVLQRDGKIPIWGSAEVGEEVVVQFAGQRKVARAGSDRKWRVDLDPIPANSQGQELTISSGTAAAPVATFTDVLVGEVWLCSGQSNMAWTVREKGINVKNAEQEQAGANYPLIRQLKAPKSNAKAPADSFQAAWTVCSPETVGGFSGVAYFFARDLFARLNVPIGIINTSYSGTPIESWLSEETFASAPACSAARARFAETKAKWPEILEAYRAQTEAWTRESEAAKADGLTFAKQKPRQPVGPGHPYSPVTVYNAMLHPIIPYGMRGAIWYQGEGNVRQADEYEGLLTALITQWREEWGQGNFPFLYVQLPNYKGETAEPDWAWLRDAQARVLAAPNTGMTVNIDVGDPNDLHPKNKQDVGKRLAALALATVYKHSDIPHSGPIFAGAERQGKFMKIAFRNAEGLEIRGAAGALEIAGEDRVFHPATAALSGQALVVSAPEVAEPVAVRYAWQNAPVACLYNAAGFPAAPFRTDDWPRASVSAR
jgi:sialate O-acetylesterase